MLFLSTVKQMNSEKKSNTGGVQMSKLTRWQKKGNLFPPTLYGFDDLFRDVVGQVTDFVPELFGTRSEKRLELEVGKTDVTAKLPVPGCKPADVSVEVVGDYLTIRAKRSDEVKKDETSRYIRRERSYEEYEETVKIPVRVVGAEARAKCVDGILTVTMPREEAEKPASHVVNVE